MQILLLTPIIFFVPLIIVVVVLLGYATTRPNKFRVERSQEIVAPPEKIYPFIADFHSWRAWSPWENIDPNLKRTYTGASAGPGAIYEWEGNSKAGKGRMEITTVAPPSAVAIKLDFEKPMEGHNITVFDLIATSPATTKVTWSMYGPVPFIGKLMSVFITMDKLLGKEFQTGLANLKSAAEK